MVTLFDYTRYTHIEKIYNSFWSLKCMAMNEYQVVLQWQIHQWTNELMNQFVERGKKSIYIILQGDDKWSDCRESFICYEESILRREWKKQKSEPGKRTFDWNKLYDHLKLQKYPVLLLFCKDFHYAFISIYFCWNPLSKIIKNYFSKIGFVKICSTDNLFPQDIYLKMMFNERCSTFWWK